jgi:hypothetical protein
VDVNHGVVQWGPLQWKASGGDGAVLLSLRPEAIRLASASSQLPGDVRFRGVVLQQIYSGASEIIEIDCGHSQILRARIPATGPLGGQHEFVFSADDAIAVSEPEDLSPSQFTHRKAE